MLGSYIWVLVAVAAVAGVVWWLVRDPKPKVVEPCRYCGAVTRAGCPNSNQCRR